MRLGLTHLGNIDIVVRAIAGKTGIDLANTPPTTQRTLSQGVKYSPETACLPFKIQLGNLIEALEMGADTLVMPGGAGPCRFGYYHKIHEQILRDLGYQFHMVTEAQGMMYIGKYITNNAPLWRLITNGLFGLTKLKTLEALEKLVHKMRAIEQDKGSATRIYREAIKAIDAANSYQALRRIKHECRARLMGLPTITSPAPIKIGVTGEFFVVLDSFTNMDVEIELGKLGVWVKRSIWLSEKVVNLNPIQHILGLGEVNKAHRAARPYVCRHLGGDGWQSVGEKVLHRKDWDGIVHLEPFGCMPEITARNIMTSIKEGPPVLNLIYDEFTGKAAMISRLEAFVDMLQRKKRRKEDRPCLVSHDDCP